MRCILGKKHGMIKQFFYEIYGPSGMGIRHSQSTALIGGRGVENIGFTKKNELMESDLKMEEETDDRTVRDKHLGTNIQENNHQ